MIIQLLKSRLYTNAFVLLNYCTSPICINIANLKFLDYTNQKITITFNALSPKNPKIFCALKKLGSNFRIKTQVCLMWPTSMASELKKQGAEDHHVAFWLLYSYYVPASLAGSSRDYSHSEDSYRLVPIAYTAFFSAFMCVLGPAFRVGLA